MIAGSLGNKELLKLHKTAFLCSRKIPATVVLKCYDWAIEQRNLGHCVISGFHSTLEQDVLHYLLAGKQPVIMVLARGMKYTFEPELNAAVDSGRLLIITPFERTVRRMTTATAEQRNRFMLELAGEVVIGYADPGGMLDRLLEHVSKPITRLKN
jgi:hypothetical protein